MIEAHENLGHRGRDAVYALLSQRFRWPGLWTDVEEHVKTCEACQRTFLKVEEEVKDASQVSKLFSRVHMDVVDLGRGLGTKRYAIIARCALSGWVEGRLLGTKTSDAVAKCVHEHILCRWGFILELIVADNGPENRGATAALLAHFKVPLRYTAPYHPQANAIFERAHKSLVEAVIRMSRAHPTSHENYFHLALWADRITTNRMTGLSLLEMVTGASPCLPMDVEFETYLFADWSTSMTTEELIAERVRQLARHLHDFQRVAVKQREARQRSLQFTDSTNTHKLRHALEQDQPVLIQATVRWSSKSDRALNHWRGPYKVVRQFPGGSDKLAELDGTLYGPLVPAHRLERFFPRGARLAQIADVGDGIDDSLAVGDTPAAGHGGLKRA